MAQPRHKLQSILEDILGTKNVYFQPPPSFIMKYPCIRYSMSGQVNEQANDMNYIRTREYTLIYINRKPDTEVVDKLLDLPMSAVGRSWVQNGLHHTTIILYF